MKPIKRWFSLGPDTEEDGREWHWYNKSYEWQNERIKLVAGDILAINEYDGGGNCGPQFSVELALAQGDIPEFYIPGNENAVYDIHWFTFIVWRWGIYFSVRGRVQ